jgi:hypothetical protein
MIPVKHIDPDDLPLYAMQLLTPEEMEELRSDLEHTNEGRRILAEYYGDLALFAHTAEIHTPPATARQRLMKAVSREKKVIPPSPLDKYAAPVVPFTSRVESTSSLLDDEPVERTFGQKALPWTGWLIAAGVGAFAFLQHQQTDQFQATLAKVKADNAKSLAQAETATVLYDTMHDPLAVQATLTLTDDAKPLPTGRVVYAAEKGSLFFVANNLQTLPTSKTYELWVIPADNSPAMPAGLFRPDKRGFASVILPELPHGVKAKAFGVTVEDADGSSVPTVPVILKGAVS